ncbi:MAG TPA: DUF6252 family protein [Puia sp.]|jgi:hypothetical protein|nr:DUF6252 family protein [Puia sp.]
MKKVIVDICLGCMAMGLFACHKYTSIESDRGLAEEMVATIDGVPWQAADSSQSAIVSQGLVTISGISVDGQEISITLNDTVVGVYELNQTSSSLAIYANLDSVGGYAYSTNQGSDTSQAGGTVNVTSFDQASRTISGVFSFKVYRNSDGTQENITSGTFYNIPYVDQ